MDMGYLSFVCVCVPSIIKQCWELSSMAQLSLEVGGDEREPPRSSGRPEDGESLRQKENSKKGGSSKVCNKCVLRPMSSRMRIQVDYCHRQHGSHWWPWQPVLIGWQQWKPNWREHGDCIETALDVDALPLCWGPDPMSISEMQVPRDRRTFGKPFITFLGWSSDTFPLPFWVLGLSNFYFAQ